MRSINRARKEVKAAKDRVAQLLDVLESRRSFMADTKRELSAKRARMVEQV